MGGDLLVGLGLVFATYMGFEAALLSGGIRTAMGLIYASIVVKYLVVALLCKLMLLEPWNVRLAAPLATTVVMLCGFGAILCATIFARILFPRSSTGWIGVAVSPMHDMKIGCALAGAALVARLVMGAVASGRGFVLPFGALLPASLSHLVFYAMNSRRRFRWIPALLVFSWSFWIGLAGASKEGMLVGLFVLGLCLLLRYRFNISTLLYWSFVLIVGAKLFYPYAQYLKSSNRSWASPATMLSRFVTDSRLREESRGISAWEAKSKDLNYLDRNVGPLERFMLIKLIDRLVSVTDSSQSHAGWITVSAAFTGLVPKYLWQGKPDFKVGNYFGRVTGILSDSDESTSTSFTLFGEFYHAFGLAGVFFGVLTFYLVFQGVLHVLIGTTHGPDPRIVSIVALTQHHLGEGALAGVLFVVLAVMAYALVAKGVEWVALSPLDPVLSRHQ